MAVVYMTRNAATPGVSNNLEPSAKQFKFYTTSYAAGSTQDPIMLPDEGVFGVTLGFAIASTAVIEISTDPPSIVEAGTANWTAVGTAVTANTFYKVEGATAVRVNRTSGTPSISVRA